MRYIKILIITGLIFTSLPLWVYSAFMDIGAGARPVGMGNAFVGIANDANAMLYNPAGLNRVNNSQLTCMYGALLAGIKNDNLGYGFLSYVQPAGKIGTFSIGITNFGSNLYSENVVIASYGTKLFSGLAIGFNLKSLSKTYKQNEYTIINPAFTNYSASGMGFDVGILLLLSDKFVLGVVGDNVNQPDIHLISEDKVPMTIKFGMGLQLGKKFNIAIDYNSYQNTSKDYKINCGIETWLSDKFALRGGLGTGNNEYNNLSLGMSIVIGKFQFDYAYQNSLSNPIINTSGNHRVSLTLDF